jgi:small subunit ribosomal protein S2
LFVGTKKQAQQCVKETAKETGQMFVTERWLGGTSDEFYGTVKTSIKRLKEIEKWETDGTLANYGKQEQAAIRREGGRLHKYLTACATWTRFPPLCSWWM